MDLMPPQASVGNVPTYGFQDPVGFVHPTSRVVAPMFKDLAKRVCLSQASARGTLPWGLCAPQGGSLHQGACSVSGPPVCGCLLVSLAACM